MPQGALSRRRLLRFSISAGCAEIIVGRHDRGPIILAAQVPVDRWHATIGDPTYADAILDRIVHNAIRIPLKGESRRKLETTGDVDPGGDTRIDAKNNPFP